MRNSVIFKRKCQMKAACLFLVLLVASVSFAANPPVGPQLQEMCVTVRAGSSGGSGTIIVRQIEGKPIAWVLTAHHVVQQLRQVSDVIAPDGSERKQVRYLDADVLQEFTEDGAKAGSLILNARIVNVDPRRDIALLRVRKRDKFSQSMSFYLDEIIPPPGTEVFHCASPAGETASLTDGIIAQIGRRIEQFGGSEAVYDQVTCSARPGSSGGMVTLKGDGRFVGMITLGLSGGDNFHYMVPVRRIREWAEEVGVTWLLDAKAKTPSESDLQKIRLEYAPAGFAMQSKDGPGVTTMELRMQHEE